MSAARQAATPKTPATPASAMPTSPAAASADAPAKTSALTDFAKTVAEPSAAAVMAAAAEQKEWIVIPFFVFVKTPAGDYVRMQILPTDKVDAIRRQLFGINKNWDLSRQRLLISRWGLNQKQSRWGATVMSPNPADCEKRPLHPQANVVDCGIKEGMVLEMTLIDPIDS